jgi:hypothetical protein
MMVNRKKLKDWWGMIKRSPTNRLADYRAPLVGCGFVKHRYGLEPVHGAGFDPARVSDPLPKDPKFKNFTPDCLPILRYRLASRDDMEIVDAWAEHLLRYCEIWRHDLKSRVSRKWPSKKEARLTMLQIAAFMIDYHEETRDPRFLNLALKLADMGWILTIRRTSAGLRSKDQDEFVAALFGVRLLLMCERAVRRMENRLQ